MKRLNSQPFAIRVLAAAVMLAALAGCQSVSNALQSDRVNYQGAGSAPPLAVPPDLTKPVESQNFVAPPVTAELGNDPTPITRSAGLTTIGVSNQQDPFGMHMERDGDQRWLVVDGRTPAQLWAPIREFWQSNGFVLQTDSPENGVMETDWAENRAKIGQDWFHKLFGKFVDGIYSSGTRDRFRTRIERGPNGTTDVFVTHQGMEEMLVGQEGETSRWTDRPRDPALEATFLLKLSEKFGLTADQANQLAANARAPVDRATVVDSSGQPTINLAEPFDRAWLRIGVALDRTDFAVDNRDRAKGIYYVRYTDAAQEVRKEGLLGKLFAGKKNAPARQFRVNVRPLGAGATQVAVLDDSGQVDDSSDARRLVSALHAQLN